MQKNYKNFITNRHNKNSNLELPISTTKDYINTKITHIKNHLKKTSTISGYKSDNRGFYIPYSLLYPDTTYEFLDELSFIVKNTNRSSGSGYDMFKWKNVLDNKIKNLLFMFIHILTIPLYPWLEKNKTSDIDKEIIDYLNLNKKIITINQVLHFFIKNKNITISISYIDTNAEFIDFSINYNYNNTYSIEFNTNTVYLYTRSNRPITDEGYLYVDIDSNDNLNNNIQLNTSLLTKNFSFKVVPITITSSYVYYKGLGQFLLRTLNELINIDYLDINIYSASYNKLTNNYINKQLIDDVSQNIIKYCECNFSEKDTKTNASCYCNYIRHPLNKNNQIDIGFKIGIIKNELITNIFH